MSVRSCLLVILSIGPAYGFQLHAELSSRTAGRRVVNAGQVYGTLERLVKQGAVESAGTTDDGLPLYRATATGLSEASVWLTATDSVVGEEWNDLVDRVLLASSHPDADVLGIIARYRQRWQADFAGAGPSSGHDPALAGANGGGRGPGPGAGQDLLGAAARRALATAALDWLDSTERALVAAGPGQFGHGLNLQKPRRGRRPAVAA
ncbi:PadR family transcriptional regulator [Cryobacterium zhongshanensis]|uniref:PadR family transcriptional regulator n=1 Tax=Cryobacterium zhongshanensis TaxID=2928153 RepID=A0AA41QV38_9MICO|nr:PadR family transcriptional regulator [Cryobacterium zhongshanensis]MCI4657795.1 PadR family transcriptional regulator [Cryobacterium zhongshanensis]